MRPAALLALLPLLAAAWLPGGEAASASALRGRAANPDDEPPSGYNKEAVYKVVVAPLPAEDNPFKETGKPLPDNLSYFQGSAVRDGGKMYQLTPQNIFQSEHANTNADFYAPMRPVSYADKPFVVPLSPDKGIVTRVSPAEAARPLKAPGNWFDRPMKIVRIEDQKP